MSQHSKVGFLSGAEFVAQLQSFRDSGHVLFEAGLTAVGLERLLKKWQVRPRYP